MPSPSKSAVASPWMGLNVTPPSYPAAPLKTRWPWFRNTSTPAPPSSETVIAMSSLPSPSKSATWTALAKLP